jgi:hypothetical protein
MEKAMPRAKNKPEPVIRTPAQIRGYASQLKSAVRRGEAENGAYVVEFDLTSAKAMVEIAEQATLSGMPEYLVEWIKKRVTVNEREIQRASRRMVQSVYEMTDLAALEAETQMLRKAIGLGA